MFIQRSDDVSMRTSGELTLDYQYTLPLRLDPLWATGYGLGRGGGGEGGYPVVSVAGYPAAERYFKAQDKLINAQEEGDG